LPAAFVSAPKAIVGPLDTCAGGGREGSLAIFRIRGHVLLGSRRNVDGIAISSHPVGPVFSDRPARLFNLTPQRILLRVWIHGSSYDGSLASQSRAKSSACASLGI